MNSDLDKIPVDQINGWLRLIPLTANHSRSPENATKLTTPVLYLSDVPIVEVTLHKHLGIYLSQKLDWQKHIEYVTEKPHSGLS